MKRIKYLFRLLSIVIFTLLLSSCKGNVTDVNNPEIQLDGEATGWKKSLYNAMNLAECETLSLESCKYLGEVTSEIQKEALLDEIFGEKQYMVIANYESNVFDIMTYGERINLTTAKNKDLFAPRKKNVASAIANKNIGVVELSWNYRGERFKSKAIVATDGYQEFIYDNIMSYVPVDNQPESSSVAKNTYRVNGKVVKEEVIELPKMNHAEAGVAKTTYSVNGKVVKEEIEDLKALTNKK